MAITVTLSDAESGLEKLLDDVRREPVIITRNGKPAGVLLSVKQYEEYERLAELFERAENEHFA